MAKKMRFKDGMLKIGKVYPHRKGWRVQVKIAGKVERGPLRSTEKDAKDDLWCLQNRAGNRNTMKRNLATLRRQAQKAKKDKEEKEAETKKRLARKEIAEELPDLRGVGGIHLYPMPPAQRPSLAPRASQVNATWSVACEAQCAEARVENGMAKRCEQ